MLKIGILQLGYETNTFLSGCSQLKDLGSGDWIPGDQIVSMFEGKRAGISGAIAAIREAGVQAVGLDSMSRGGAFNAGPMLSRDCVEQAMDHICGQLEGMQLDGLFFANHGAGCAEGYPDADSYFLQRLRRSVGHIPIMCSLDLHANITQKMVELADGLFGIKEYPHTDFYEASYLATKTLIRTLQGRCSPRMALVRMPLLVAAATGCTIGGFAGQIRDHVRDYAARQRLLDATFFHGFEGCDTPDTCASIVTVADGFDPSKQAQALAEWVFKRRDRFSCKVYTPADAITEAKKLVKGGYVVLNEGTDNPGSGCPGDGTHLLQELLRQNVAQTIMGPVFDPEAAGLCHSHKVGDEFELTFGGKTDPLYGAPITARVHLLALCDGVFQCATPVHRGAVMCYGPSARIKLRNVEVILVSKRFQTYDDRPFTMTGADMGNYKIVALKSMTHFKAYFTDTADAIVAVSTPSTVFADIRDFPYKNINRPIYPLEEI